MIDQLEVIELATTTRQLKAQTNKQWQHFAGYVEILVKQLTKWSLSSIPCVLKPRTHRNCLVFFKYDSPKRAWSC